jgi:hypothetical protein
MGWRLESALLLLIYVFTVFPFRKLYAEVSDLNYEQLRSGVGRLFREEACLAAHEYFAGGYHDLHVLSITREGFEEIVDGPFGAWIARSG